MRAAGRAALALLLAGSCLALTGASATTGAAAGATVPRLSWTECADGFECATATVPLDYDQPSGRAITLALVRLPAADPAHRIGSLFLNPGGPGNSSVDFVRQAARTDYPPGVLDRFDIIGMDPRGVGGSTPVRCFADGAEAEAFFADYNVLPVNRAELVAQAAKVSDLAGRCRARAAWLLPHLSTANVARDMDLVRRAVGDPRLNYAGYSYGTYLGATYAHLYPNRIRAMVLDANTFPPGYARGPEQSTAFVRAHANEAGADTLGQFFALCAEAGPACAFSAGGDPATTFAALADRLRRDPLVLPDGRRVGYAELLDLTLNGLYQPAGWAEVASILQQIVAVTFPATSPGASPVATPPATRRATATVSGAPYDNTRDALFANVCSETDNPSSPLDYATIAARADRLTPYAGGLWTYLTLPCSVWPARDQDSYTGPWQFRTPQPALVMNNRHDPATPLSNAVTMTRLMPGSRLVTVEGWGHTARATHSPCANAILEQYLTTLRLPPSGTSCRPGVVPFG
jgi:pimeloyl-ACP methyl ester carboxylesterase